jgi:hypothetical protein
MDPATAPTSKKKVAGEPAQDVDIETCILSGTHSKQSLHPLMNCFSTLTLKVDVPVQDEAEGSGHARCSVA